MRNFRKKLLKAYEPLCPSGRLVGWLVRRRPVMITEIAGSFRALTVKLVN